MAATTGKPRSSSTAAIGIATFSVSGFPHSSATASRSAARERDVRPADAALVRQLEDPLRARVERPVQRMAEARHPAAGVVDLARDLAGLATRRDRLLEQPRALLRRAEDDRPGAEDPGRDGSLQRSRVGRERHPRRDVRRHQPVLRDRDQQQVEEVALVLGRLVAGQQQVEVLGEADPAHQVAGEVAPADLDPVGIRPG